MPVLLFNTFIALMTFLYSFPALLKIVTTEIEHNILPKCYTKAKYRQRYFFPGSIPISKLRISLVLLATRHAEISCSVENAHHLQTPFKVSISYHKFFNLLMCSQTSILLKTQVYFRPEWNANCLQLLTKQLILLWWSGSLVFKFCGIWRFEQSLLYFLLCS